MSKKSRSTVDRRPKFGPLFRPHGPQGGQPVHDTSRKVHPHSRAGLNEQVLSGRLAARAERVLAAIRTIGPCTDREVMRHLRLGDMDAVRPRITELKQAGRLAECGKIVCPTTGKKVRLVRAVDVGGPENSEFIYEGEIR